MSETKKCAICLDTVANPVNFCPDKCHDSVCKECASDYIDSLLASSFHGSCPALYCPVIHDKKSRRLLVYDEWKSEFSSASSKYTSLANSLLGFLCGGCHAMKTLDVGFEASKSADSYKTLKSTLGEASKEAEFFSAIETFAWGGLSVEDFYEHLIKTFFPKLASETDANAWDIFKCVLKSISNPERRANLHLRYLRDRPRIKTLCCSHEHCYNCQIKGFHEGKTCVQYAESLDHSIVHCPSCGIALAKGDGCNTITCFCGKQFSWSDEKKNNERVHQFLEAFPVDTTERCAAVLCEANQAKDGTLIQLAKAWQLRNQIYVNQHLQQYFIKSFAPCPSQCCATLNFDRVPCGIKQGADMWTQSHSREVAKLKTQHNKAKDSLFTTLVPNPSDRPAAAHQLFDTQRTLAVEMKQRQKLAEESGIAQELIKVRARMSPDELLLESARAWTNNNPEAYANGVAALEARSVQQFLTLFGDRPMNSLSSRRLNSCCLATEWDIDISNSSLEYTNFNTTVKRPGSVSCYPACFARVPADLSSFRVVIDAASRSSNWLTFGVAYTVPGAMANSSSDGVGRTRNTYGLSDDRSSSTSDVVFASCGTEEARFRKLRTGDTLSATLDTAAGYLDINISDEFEHRFTIPIGTADNYLYAMTFANDHQVTILDDDIPPVTSSQPATKTANTTSSSAAVPVDPSNSNAVFPPPIPMCLPPPVPMIKAGIDALRSKSAGNAKTSGSEEAVKLKSAGNAKTSGSEVSLCKTSGTDSNDIVVLNKSQGAMLQNYRRLIRILMESATSTMLFEDLMPSVASAQSSNENARPMAVKDKAFLAAAQPLLNKTASSTKHSWMSAFADCAELAANQFDAIRPMIDAFVNNKDSSSVNKKCSTGDDNETAKTIANDGNTGKESSAPLSTTTTTWVTYRTLLSAVVWYREHAVEVEKRRLEDMACTFFAMYGESAPFRAAMNCLCPTIPKYGSPEGEEYYAAVAFMRTFSDDMNTWYVVDQFSDDPIVERVDPNCSCLPRHAGGKKCPCPTNH